MKKVYSLLFAMAVVLSGCSNRKAVDVKPKEPAMLQNDSNEVKPQSGSATVSYLSTADFRNKVMDFVAHPNEWVYSGTRPVVIDFYATWCRPCKMMSPIVEEMAKSYSGKVDFYKVDIDKEQELAQVFGIQSIPIFLFVPVKGQPTVQMGAMGKQEFEMRIKEYCLLN